MSGKIGATIVVHVPEKGDQYKYLIKVLEDSISHSVNIVYFISSDSRAFVRYRNIRLALRNSDLIRYFWNRFLSFVYRGSQKVYEDKKKEYVSKCFTPHGGVDLERMNNVYFIDDLNQETDLISRINPKLLVMGGGRYVKQEVLDKFQYAINVHLGSIPKYRGARTIEWALLNRDFYELKATIHSMTKEIDKGVVIKKYSYKGSAPYVIGDVHYSLFKQVFDDLPRVISQVLEKGYLEGLSDLVDGVSSVLYYGYMISEYHYYTLLSYEKEET